MLIIEKFASNYYKKILELEITSQEEDSFQQSTICWLCENPLGDEKVRDHDHLTGKYRGAAHIKCNLNCKKGHQVLFPYLSTTFPGMIVILRLKNS